MKQLAVGGKEREERREGGEQEVEERGRERQERGGGHVGAVGAHVCEADFGPR